MKYSLTKNTKEWFGKTLFQIKAEISFGSVSKGELGGYIEKEANLSQSGNAWVSGNAWLSGNARVYGDARVYGNAWVYGDARVSGDAWVYGDARVYGDACVYGDALVYGNARVYAKAHFTKGKFIGGDDSGKITDITKQTGSTYWKNQYVLGDYEIKPIVEEKSLSGQEVSVTIGDKTYKEIIK
jgi:carbonic anhydrase/acetyltransferase-like protein (isoleucine patch superfamily)